MLEVCILTVGHSHECIRGHASPAAADCVTAYSCGSRSRVFTLAPLPWQAKRLPYSGRSREKDCRAGAPPATIHAWAIHGEYLSGYQWEQRVIYFVTMCVEHRQSVLANDDAFEAFKTAAGKLQHWRVLASVVMPEHLHVIVAPTEDRGAKLGNCSATLKRWMREELNASWNFQPGRFDRLLRSDESLHEKWLYVRENPVRAGLVKHWKDWPYQIGLDDV